MLATIPLAHFKGFALLVCKRKTTSFKYFEARKNQRKQRMLIYKKREQGMRWGFTVE